MKGSAVRHELDMRIPSLNLKNSKSYCLNTLVKRNIPEIPNVLMLFILFVQSIYNICLYILQKLNILMNLPIENLRKRYNCQVPSTFSFGTFRNNG